MNFAKRMIHLNGNVSYPLKTKEKAKIICETGVVFTSPVIAILRVSQDSIVFETKDSIYCVSAPLLPEPMAIPIGMAVCA